MAAAVVSIRAEETGEPSARLVARDERGDVIGYHRRAADHDDPLGVQALLVKSTSIPPAGGGELHRLNPTRIIVVGGPAIITRSVQEALGVFVP